MGLPIRDQAHHTYADYRSWPEDRRYELIDGIAYLMAPAPTVAHQTIAFEIGRQAGNALDGKPCRVLVAPLDVRLPKPGQSDDETDTVVQPDVLVVCDPARLEPRGVRGAPDWIVEVLSPATASHDQILKRRIYEQAGVREYWMVHPQDRVLTIYRLADGNYGVPDIGELTDETVVAAVPDVVIRWAPIVELLGPQEPG
ncbi:MAG: Uma2 family endonuclease [Gammaproteobacteria bacterium]|nr:Uma2 family endonuclease [Gammaproteobacteria bacterium]MBU1645979.1 Uma2 family endonuclease [Gammaproteobacteria bacterium]MBU1972041.1 Uma2 family endonuclease [Gammaproteobacteria bacterium]